MEPVVFGKVTNKVYQISTGFHTKKIHFVFAAKRPRNRIFYVIFQKKLKLPTENDYLRDRPGAGSSLSEEPREEVKDSVEASDDHAEDPGVFFSAPFAEASAAGTVRTVLRGNILP